MTRNEPCGSIGDAIKAGLSCHAPENFRFYRVADGRGGKFPPDMFHHGLVWDVAFRARKP